MFKPLGFVILTGGLLGADLDQELFKELYKGREAKRDKVERLLARGANPSARVGGRTPLGLATNSNRADLVEALLAHDAEVNTRMDGGSTILENASLDGNVRIVKLLIAHGADLDLSFSGLVPLAAAAKQGHLEVVKLLLDGGAMTNPEGALLVPLAAAAQRGDLEVAKLLLDSGAMTNPPGALKDPLNEAATRGHAGVVALLLERGANPATVTQILDARGQLASERYHVTALLIEGGAKLDLTKQAYAGFLEWSARNGHSKVIKQALLQGVKPWSVGKEPLSLYLERNGDKDTADRVQLFESGRYWNAVYDQLWKACTQGDEDLLRDAIEKGARLDVKDSSGRTPLHIASQNGHHTIVAFLLQQGVRWTTSTNRSDPFSPLLLASREGHPEVIRELLRYGALVDERHASGYTPLLVSAVNGNVAALDVLLRAGASVDVRDEFEMTALMHAAARGRTVVTERLLAAGAAPNLQDKLGRTALGLAAAGGVLGSTNDRRTEFVGDHEDSVRALLTAGAMVNEDILVATARKGYRGLLSVLRASQPSMITPQLDSRLAIVLSTSSCKDPARIEEVLARLRDKNSSVRQQAVLNLRDSSDPCVLGWLTDAVKDADWEVRAMATSALGVKSLADDRSVIPLTQMLKDGNDLVRQFAVKSLATIGGQQSVSPLIGMLKDKNQDVRIEAIDGLGRIGGEQAVAPLVNALVDPNPAIRSSAASALGEIRLLIALPRLIEALRDGHPWVRGDAAAALGKLGDGRAIGPLYTALRDPDAQVGEEAAKALAKFTDRGVERLIAALKDPSPNARVRAADILGYRHSVEAIPSLIALLRDSNYAVNQSAAHALGRIGAPAVDALLSAFSRETSIVRMHIAMALGETGDSRVRPVLISEGLEKGDLGIIAGAHRFFIRLGRPDSEKILLSALQKHFTKVMASNLLSCGNKWLESATRKEVLDRGYTITPDLYGFAARWGGSP